MSDIIVGLDIGTSFVRAVIGELAEDNTLQISGVGKSVSSGLRKGIIVNIESTMRAIAEAIEGAEMVSGYEASSCVVAIGGNQVDGLNSKGLVAIPAKGRGTREVTRDDIDRVIEAAKAIVIPMDRQILHVIPQTYAIDGQGGIKNPKDMIGVRLEVEVHIITSAITSLQNIQRCLTRADYNLTGVMLKTLAASQAVMPDEEMELGSILIDLGGGTTDILVLYGGAPICTASIPYGGEYVTNDIRIIKGVSTETAERIKLSSGCCWEKLLDEYEYEEVIIPGVGGRPPESISRTELCQIIQPRVEEILTLARREIIKRSEVESLSGSIVLTGGGALLPGIVELTQHVFRTSAVRIGYSGQIGAIAEEFKSPEYATAVGLLLFSMQQKYGQKQKHLETKHSRKYNVGNRTKGKSLAEKARSLFDEFF